MALLNNFSQKKNGDLLQNVAKVQIHGSSNADRETKITKAEKDLRSALLDQTI